jgi:hypothetical protein
MGTLHQLPNCKKVEPVSDEIVESIFRKIAEVELLRRENAELIRENLRLKELVDECNRK